MEKLNICLTSISKVGYSETFIQNLKRVIDGNIFYCFGGYIPIESEDGKLKNHFSAPLVVKAFSKLGIIKKPLDQFYFESYLKRNNIQLIVANYGPAGAELCEISRELKIPMIVHFHGYDASVNRVIEQFKGKYQRMFEIAKAIIVVSSEMKAKLLSLGAIESKVFLFRCAPASEFIKIYPNYQSNQITAVGRFVEKKAPYLTMVAFQKAQILCRNLKLKFVGDGMLLQVCKDLAIAMKINNIEFKGVLPPEEIIKEMSNSFCFIQHSKTAVNGDKEGTPVAVLEAMASALPVISTYHAGIPDIIQNNENGFLVQEGDVEGMANAIVKLFKDRKMAEDFGKNNRKYIKEHLSQSQYKLDWNNLIQHVVYGN